MQIALTKEGSGHVILEDQSAFTFDFKGEITAAAMNATTPPCRVGDALGR
ncbi:hypothetical protein [Hydrogenophaga sp. 2FB]